MATTRDDIARQLMGIDAARRDAERDWNRMGPDKPDQISGRELVMRELLPDYYL